MSKTLPNAWVCTNDLTLNYKNRGRRAVQHNKIYLKDGEEFEIELFNPMSENVLAIISLDGKSISSSGLVVRSGQRFYLDCFYDDLKKFVFKTYEIDNTSESKAAVAKNGLLEIQFYKEKILKKYDAEKIVEIHHHHHDYYPYRPYYNPYWYGTGTLTIGSTNVLRSGNLTTGTANFTNTTGTSTNTNYNATSNNMNLSDCGSVFTSTSAQNSATLEDSLTFTTNSLETGQVDKGAESNQKFASVDMDFEDNVLNKISFQLLPESRKPADVASFEKKKIVLNADEIELNGNLKINGNSQSSDKISKLLQLKEMLKEELITKDEFEMFKREI
jgi:hypothetical protein